MSGQDPLGPTLIRPENRASAVDCLNESDVLAFLDGTLTPGRALSVEGHLAECAECRQLLAFMAKEESAAGRRPAPPPEPLLAGELGPGQRVDHFEIERLLGKGGMGEIYLARDTQLHRAVALKVIAPGLLDAPEAQERFFVEARATARFNHPHVVTIHSVGRDRGRPYLALEYVEGETLRARLDRGPVPLTEALQIARAIAAALHEAHRHQVLHRDLKPQNVMIGRDGRTRVLDFGLAKLVAPGPSDTHSLFETKLDGKDTLRGTPAYMAPEQWKKEPVGAPADVWALGVIFYELLSGTRPFREPSPIAYAVKVCEAGPAPPLPNPSGLPPPVVEMVAACLAKRAEERPTAATLMELLDGLLGDDSLRLANELERAAERWESAGQPEGTLWDRQKLDSAQRLLAERAFPLAAPAARFLSASLQLEGRRADGRKKRLVGLAFGLGTVALAFLLIARVAFDQRAVAQAQREAAENATAQALLEGARLALTQGEIQVAQAKLRAALERRDSPAARVLLDQLESEARLASGRLSAGIYGLAVSPDGATVAVAAQDHTIYLYDSDLLNIRSLRGHDDQVIEVAFAPDGRHLASASWSGELLLWDLVDGSARAFPAGPRVTGLAFDPSGAHLAASDLGGGLRIFTLDGDLAPRVVAAEGIGHDLLYDGDAQHLSSADRDGVIRRYSTTSWTVVERLTDPGGPSPAITLARSEHALFVGREDGRVTRFAPGSPGQDVIGRNGAIQRLAVAKDILYGGGADGVVWRLPEAGGAAQVLGRHPGGVWGLAVQGAVLVSASQDGTIHRWRPSGPRARPVGPTDSVAALSFDPQGRLLAAGYDRRLLRFDGGAAQVLGGTAEGTLYGLAAAGPYYATASLDRRVRLYDQTSLGRERQLEGHLGGVYGVAFRPDASQLASAGSDGTVRLWDPKTGAAAGVVLTAAAPVFAVAWSPDGRQLAAGGADRRVYLWERGPKERPRILTEVPGTIRGLAFAPDGQSLAVVGYDPVVRQIQLNNGVVQELGAHRGRVYGVAYSPDGRSLASVGADGQVQLFDRTGGARRSFAAHPGEINAVAFAPDGNSLATGGDDGTVRRFDLEGRALDRPAPAPSGPKLDARQKEALALAGAAETVCLWDGQSLEAWDRPLDQRRFATPLSTPAEVWPWNGGCVALSRGRLLRFDPQGAFLEVASAVEAANTRGDRLIYASGRRVRRLNPALVVEQEVEVGIGATAVAFDGAALWAGYANGMLERLGPGGTTLGQGGTSRVTKLVVDQGLLAAGHENGLFELYDPNAGARIATERLHGPIAEVELGNAVSVKSALGQQVLGPTQLERDRCATLRQLWTEAPLVWQSGRVTRSPPPKDHPCNVE